MLINEMMVVMHRVCVGGAKRMLLGPSIGMKSCRHRWSGYPRKEGKSSFYFFGREAFLSSLARSDSAHRVAVRRYVAPASLDVADPECQTIFPDNNSFARVK